MELKNYHENTLRLFLSFSSFIFCCSFIIFIFFLVLTAQIHADVVTDGRAGLPMRLGGPDFHIPDTLGSRKGNNLFHSFETFSIARTETATFTGPDEIKNVISRVTGGEVSIIDGLIRSTVGQADFIFINPDGIVLGPDARVDVPAAFHLSTADELIFADGVVFSVSSPDSSHLTHAAPESFGFLNTKQARIEIQSQLLAFPQGSRISLSAADVSIKGNEDSYCVLTLPGGSLDITATGEEKTVIPVVGSRMAVDNSLGADVDVSFSGEGSGSAEGNVHITRASLDTSGESGGHVSVQAGNLILDSAFITAGNTGDCEVGAGLEFRVNGNFEIKNGCILQTNTSGMADSGEIKIDAGTLLMSDENEDSYTATTIMSSVAPGAHGDAGNIRICVAENCQMNGVEGITSITLGNGNTGGIEIKSGRLFGIENGGAVSTVSFAGGDAGNVTIDAGDIIIDNGGTAVSKSGVFSWSDVDARGKTGKLQLTANGSLELYNGASLSTFTLSQFSEQTAGDISIHAGNMKLDGLCGDLFTGVDSISLKGAKGSAGGLEIHVDGSMEVLNGAAITTSTHSEKNAGRIFINTETLMIDNHGLENQSTGIFSEAQEGAGGDAGYVEIRTQGALYLLNGGQISTATWSETGNAGDIIINAGEMTIQNKIHDGQPTAVASSAECPASQGKSGRVEISVQGTLEMLSNAQIYSSTWSNGNAGDVVIRAGELMMDGQGDTRENAFLTVIGSTAEPGSGGRGGEIDIIAEGSLEMRNGALIAASTLSRGDAGEIKLAAGRLVIESSDIQSAAGSDATGLAGSIVIEAGSVWLDHSAGLSTASYQIAPEPDFSTVDQQKIDLKTGSLFLDNGSSITSESWSILPASDIHIESGRVVMENKSRIETSSWLADGGDLAITADFLVLDHSFVTTSVEDTTGVGDGGDIIIRGVKTAENDTPISSGFLIMKEGFIQANTAAENASGGDIFIHTDGVILDKSTRLQVGGSERLQFESSRDINVIQAAAPGGEQGRIQIDAPELNISGSVFNMAVRFSDEIVMATDFCRALGEKTGSALIEKTGSGQGGKPEPSSSIQFDVKRVGRLLKDE